MTKIKRAPKRNPSTHPGIASFIVALRDDNSKDDELPGLLLPIVEAGWKWPRTDLQHWIAPLNRFDTILEHVVRDYDLGSMDHPQTNAFTPRTKELVHSVLAFEKVLLENSTNRKIYASFDVSVVDETGSAAIVPLTPDFSPAALERPTPHYRH